MDSLPDELLLAILGRIGDGLTLLDAVPLVCKRWLRLSREPEAWADVALDFQLCAHGGGYPCGPIDDPWVHGGVFESARVLARAPALRRLCFGRKAGVMEDSATADCPHVKRIALAALRQSRANVRMVDLSGLVTAANRQGRQEHLADVAVLTDFLLQSRSGLRDLGLLLDLEGFKLDTLLPQFAGLERLRLRLGKGCVGASPPGEALRGALPRLTHLQVRLDELTGTEEQALADLVGVAAGSLRQLHLTRVRGWWGLPSNVLAQVRRCKGLRELACHVLDVAGDSKLLADLPLLRSLSLDAEGRHAQDGPDMVAAADSIFFTSLASLRHLRVHLWTGPDELLQDESLRLLDALVTAAPRVTTLETPRLVMCHPLLANFIARLSHLRSVDLGACVSEVVLHALAELPTLEAVTASINCGAEYYINCRCQDAIDHFRLKRPGVQAKLEVHNHDFLRYGDGDELYYN